MAENKLNIASTFTIGGDLEVNRMGYGAMRITGKGIWGPPIDHAVAIEVLQKTRELGVNFIDTADSYGPNVSEELIAEALHPYNSDLVVATKGGLMRSGPDIWTPNGHPDYLQKALEGSLKRLKVERIDLYQLHRIDAKVPFEDQMHFLQQAQEQGLIRHIGLSEVSVTDLERAMKFIKVTTVQNMYSFGNRRWEDVLTFSEENGIGFIPWYPLDAGKPGGTDRLQEIAEKRGVTEYQVALSWLFHRSPNLLLIPGTSSVKHLEENVQARNVVLTAEDMAYLG